VARGNNTKHLRAEDFRVNEEDRPGWVRATDNVPAPGDSVYCAGGEGTVVSLHGKTGDGSRLIQIRLGDGTPPFFAAASNVLVMPAKRARSRKTANL
jgi:hypothetical protein